MRKLTTLILALLVLLSCCVTAMAEGNVETVIMYVRGTEPNGYQGHIEIVNEKLAEIGVKLEQRFVEGAAWEEKMNLLLATGERIDIMQTLEDSASMANYYGRGALMDISDLVDQYGANIKASMPESVLEGAYIGNGMYSVPTYWVKIGTEGAYTVNNYILEQYGLEVPTTREEILDVVEAVMAQWEGDEMPYLSAFATEMYNPTSTHTTVLHSDYEVYPFTVIEALFLVTQDGEVQSWVESDAFREDAAFMNEAYTRGLLDPDILMLSSDQANARLNRGNFVVHFGTVASLTNEMLDSYPDMTVDSITAHYLNPDKGTVSPWAFKNANVVPITSGNPEGAVKLLNWLVSSQENYDLLVYGVEGINYELDENGMITMLGSSSDANYWSYSSWKIGNVNFYHPDKRTFTEMETVLYSGGTPENAMVSPAAGFTFDTSDITTEYADVQTVLASAITPIVMGVQDYDTYFPAALQQLKDAGLDTVLAAYQEQLAAHLAE